MNFELREYQSRATTEAKVYLKAHIEPCLIDAAPAAGKSFMVADLALWIHRASKGKKVLALQPNAKLVKQNVEKYRMTGERCSIFSASAGSKSTRHPVVFATPKTVGNSIERFLDDYCAVIIDEAHGLTPTISSILEAMQKANPNLRIIGLTGTPYRMRKGYIFREWPDGKVNQGDTSIDPYFTKMVYRVTAAEMLEQGYITPMEVVTINDESLYDTTGVRFLPNGSLDQSSVENAFEGHGRKTSGAVRDIMAQVAARDIKGGVMIFAATQRHAQEIMASLPEGNSAISTGDHGILKGKPATEDAIVKAYRNREFRYLVSVNKYSVGFDVDHTEFIALMRYSESPDLTVQILGRAWRLHPDKPMSYVADYCGNIDRHFPDGNIYEPQIRAQGGATEGKSMDATCEACGYVNEFKMNPDYEDYQVDANGYCLDIIDRERLQTEWGPIPAHYGRRCWGNVPGEARGTVQRCGYYWTSKECEECGEANDIAARYCRSCKAEIVDPNERIVAEFKARRRDPTQPQTDKVVLMNTAESVSKAGNETLRVEFQTNHRIFTVWFMKNSTYPKKVEELNRFLDATNGGAQPPETVSYIKEKDSNFYRILAYGLPVEEPPKEPERAANGVILLQKGAKN